MSLIFLFIHFISMAFAQVLPMSNGQLELRHEAPGQVQLQATQGARSQSASTASEAGVAVLSGAAEAAANIADCRGTPTVPSNPASCQLILDLQRGMNRAAQVVQPSDRLREMITARGFQASPQLQIQAAQTQVAGYQTEITTALNYTINPDGSLISPDGTVILPENFLQPNADLLSYGLTQAQINQLAGVINGLAANGLDYSLVNRPSPSDENRLPASVPNSTAQSILNQIQEIPTNTTIQTGGTFGSSEDLRPDNIDRLSVNFRGTPIAPASGNVFRLINNAYGKAGLYEPR